MIASASTVVLFGLGVALRRPGAAAGGALGASLATLLIVLLLTGVGTAAAAAIAGTIAAFATGPLPWIALSAAGLSDLDRRVAQGEQLDRPRAFASIDDAYSALTWSVAGVAAVLAATGVALVLADELWSGLLALAFALVAALRSRAFPLRAQAWALWAAVAAIATTAVLSQLTGELAWLGAVVAVVRRAADRRRRAGLAARPHACAPARPRQHDRDPRGRLAAAPSDRSPRHLRRAARHVRRRFVTLDLRALPTALFGSGVAESTALTGWDAAIRGGLSTTRRIGFVSLAEGSGASSLAHEVTRIVASRRAEPVLAIDVCGDASGLGARLGVETTPAHETRAGARTTADALTDLPGRDGWYALRPVLATPADAVDAWLNDAAPITRFFDVSITDFGVRHPLVDLASCAALCDVVCIVSDATRPSAELARAVAPAISLLPENPRTVLALVDHAREGDAVARAVAADGTATVSVPFDQGLHDGGRPRSLAARRALLRLAATLVAASEPEGVR